MRRSIFITVLVLILPRVLWADLRADEIALIVNRGVPESAQLADFYIKARRLPEGRVIELDLPAGDEISFDQYERQVVPQVRRFLEDHKLKDKIRCIVTMYGVPLRIGPRVNSPEDQAELRHLQSALADTLAQIQSAAQDVEKRAAALDPSFKPLEGESVEMLARRIDRSSQTAAIGIQRMSDADERQQKTHELTELLSKLRKPASTSKSDPTTAPSTTQPASNAMQLAERRFDPDARRELRGIAARDGIVSYARILEIQSQYLATEQTGAAFDNELALLWWPNYPREKFMANPLSYPFIGSASPPVMMTMRLDGPTPQTVRDIIATSIQVEREGLAGKVVVDGGGAKKLDPERKQPLGYWVFEQKLSNLALLLRQKTDAQVICDDRPEVLPPKSVKDVAVYTGWYSLSTYVPACSFVRGAVGYHIASFEMTSLREPNNEWCRGLLNDGVIATIGPVSEPYLVAFPGPDDFIPLLLTGKLTLAECYWRTEPMTSWQMCIVGDPLYTPYQKKPVLQISDLPPRLQPIFSPPVPSR